MTASKGLGTYGNGVGVVTPLDHKLAQSGLIAKASGNTIRPGVFWGGTANLVTGRAGMGYDVAAFTAALSRSAAAGTVLLANDGVVTVATTTAPTSNSRYDIVYVWQREYSLDGTDSNPVIGVVQGTAAASPAVPALTAYPGAIALATILVPAGITATNSGATITQSFPITWADSGVPTFPDAAARTRSITAPTLGMYCVLASDGFIYRYSGSAWVAVNNDTGWITVTIASVTGLTASPALQYRVKNGEIWLRGQLTYSSGFPNSGGYLTVATLPVGARPGALLRLGGATFQSATARSPVINIGTDGVMTVAATGATFNDVYLNGIHYLPD